MRRTPKLAEKGPSTNGNKSVNCSVITEKRLKTGHKSTIEFKPYNPSVYCNGMENTGSPEIYSLDILQQQFYLNISNPLAAIPAE